MLDLRQLGAMRSATVTFLIAVVLAAGPPAALAGLLLAAALTAGYVSARPYGSLRTTRSS